MIRPLPEALRRKAEIEINEKEERRESDVAAVREWLKKQAHLSAVTPSDQWITAFLRGCKFSLERSKEKLDMYYTLKTLVPEFFSQRDPLDPKIQEILKLGTFLPLIKCAKEDGPRVSIVRVGIFDPSKYHLVDLLKVCFMITEILMIEDDNFTVCGEEVIVDMKGVGISVLSQWTPALAKKVIKCFEEALPLRMKGTHMLNAPPGFESAYAIFKAFLGEKLKKRMQVHNQKQEELYKAIPRAILPKEYGGFEGTIEELREHWKIKVENYRSYFLEEEKAKSDELLRSGLPKTTSALFGVEGSFRKLEID